MDAVRQKGFDAFAGGGMERAIQCFTAYLVDCPEDLEVCAALGSALKREGRFAEAVCRFQEALRLKPGSARLRSNLGATFLEWGQSEAAVRELEKAVGLAPRDVELRFNLGTALLLGARHEDASRCFREVIRNDPGHHRAFTNLGSSLKARGLISESVEMFERAARLDPNFAFAQWNLALGKLTLGDFEEGWRLYEWRREVPGIPLRRFESPRWEGGEDHWGTLMVHAEQGLGDTFQFCRFLSLARSRVGKLVFLCHEPLARALEEVQGVDQLCVREEALPDFDFQVPLMSLPWVLGLGGRLDPGGPYLTPNEHRRQLWEQRLSDYPGYKVGLCWRGNPDYREDGYRSIGLSELGPLFAIAEVVFVSLQKEDPHNELERSALADRMVDWSAELDRDHGAFVDSAALVAGLDLVITSDTAIAHLAGGMGRPVWLLLPGVADWRWELGLETTRWYPTMRIFRQRVHGEWGELVERVGAALRAHLPSTSRS